MPRFRFCLVLPLILVLLSVPALAGVEKQHSFSGDNLTVTNLIGTIRVEGHGGSDFEVHVSIEGDAAAADLIRVETREGADAGLAVVFPIEQHTRYVYPELGSSSKTTLSLKDDGRGWVSRILGGVMGSDHIEVRGSGSGLQVWADVTVRVPSGSSLKVSHGVGRVEADGVSAELVLKVRSGSVAAADIHGDLNVDTGSGNVAVTDVTGDLNVDTGSGNVAVAEVTGDVLVDTGSGNVEIESIRAVSINIDTGSGRVRASSVSADEVEIDTGSGSVVLELDRMGDGEFNVDTGSGSISVKLPPGASARLKADTGSGGIDLDLGGAAQILHQDRDSLVAQLGEGGARVDLDAGSGSIRIFH